MLTKSNISQQEMLNRWNAFQFTVINLTNQSRPEETPHFDPPVQPSLTLEHPSKNPSIDNKRIEDTASRRFIKTPCGSIKDTETNLEWFVGPNKNMDFIEAQEWVNSLTACGGHWKVPTMSKLRAIFDKDSTQE